MNTIVQEVICKFIFTSLTKWKNYDGTISYTLKFTPVTGGSEENKMFWKYTPSGNFEFTTINEEAAKMFQFGYEYYVTFKEAVKEEVKK